MFTDCSVRIDKLGICATLNKVNIPVINTILILPVSVDSVVNRSDDQTEKREALRVHSTQEKPAPEI